MGSHGIAFVFAVTGLHLACDVYLNAGRWLLPGHEFHRRQSAEAFELLW